MDLERDEILFQALGSPGMAVSGLSREEWLKVGMALKEGGYPVSIWDDWSQADSRYKRGECERLWKGFGGKSKKVTIASVIKMAEDYGWSYKQREWRALSWDDEIEYDGEGFTGFGSAPQKEMPPGEELKTYLDALFQPDDIVGFVTSDVWKNGDKWSPSKGNYTMTKQEIIEELYENPNDIQFAIGSWEEEAGAWIRFNPLDGKGVKNENVKAFRFALVESDTLPIEEQNIIYRRLELPIAALVHSGNKSLHAIVHIDAASLDEYRERVDYLYEYLAGHGVEIDKQNRNPSRLSRMPGVTRNGIRQKLLATNIGRKSWADWMDYTEGEGDELPEVESWEDIKGNIPDPPPELIEGILRQGHKMLISGSSKAGKSFLLMELCLAIAEGRKWLNYQCNIGRVLYVNLEIDPASCLNRFKSIIEALGWNIHHPDNLRIWNLRGYAKPLDELVPKLTRRVRNHEYIAVVIDPIYKIITGDENNASEMGRFCNQFDKIARETGCSVIYCHHHSKGSQGSKRAIDRASGSGVFARDPDAQLDMIELQMTANQRAKLADDGATAWRLETSLREFPNIRPLSFWFRYPIHELDTTGELDKLHAQGSPEANLEKSGNRTTEDQRLDELIGAYEALAGFDGEELPTIDQLADYMGKSARTIRRHIDEFSGVFEKVGTHGKYIRKVKDNE